MAPEATLRDDRAVAAAAVELASAEPRFARAIDLAGPLSLEAREGGFAALMRAVVGQQVSAAAARSIWTRLAEGGFDDPQRVAAADEATLRAFGLSRQKVRYVQGIARADLDFAALERSSNAEVVAALTELPGIGRWTAEIYAIFALRRADVFAAGDLALQEASRLLFELPSRPSEAQLRQLAQGWAPWRSVAARLLWRSYRALSAATPQ